MLWSSAPVWQGRGVGVRDGSEVPEPAQSYPGWISLYDEEPLEALKRRPMGCDLYFQSIIRALRWRKDNRVASSKARKLYP